MPISAEKLRRGEPGFNGGARQRMAGRHLGVPDGIHLFEARIVTPLV